ncbi:hypothetical protein OEZ85_009546 [Tetradesmus obliquus]|uniref:Uncharacterized protein n=1 Tax=Tetradesmus obliquus TaxID=3088 RepID=A0ABY8UA44_TETOB|nr:hypothetical protein OEZ85_009546 [Tetradesmus obliquus]
MQDSVGVQPFVATATRQPGKPARLMGLAPSSRLDFVMGASEPTSSLPTREAVMSISPAALTRTEEVLP